MNNVTPAVKNIIILNVIMFLADYIVPFLLPLESFRLTNKLALYYFSDPSFQPYQLFTHFFVHGGIVHIAFNMFSLYSIGSLLERYWGSKRVLNFYLICGLGAGVFYLLVQSIQIYTELGHFMATKDELIYLGHKAYIPAVGASGAVFGIFAAVALLFPNSEFFIFFIPFPIKAKHLLIGVVIISVLLGLANFKGDPIAHFGHLGGILTGYILTKYMNKDKRRFY